MPRKQLTLPVDSVGDAVPSGGLAGWQATGLALAAASVAILHGVGTLLGAIVFAPVVYALVRLRTRAPDAHSTSGLVGSALGPRAAAFTGIAQVIGYASVISACVQAVGLGLLPASTIDSGDPMDPVHLNTWLWSLYAVTTLVVAAVLVFALPAPWTAGLIALLALAGLLTFFYFGLAVLARVYLGDVPGPTPGYGPPTLLGIGGALTTLAVGLAGFEVVTTRGRGTGSDGWPMGLAIGAVTVCALVVWQANQQAGSGTGPFDGEFFSSVVADLYGQTGATVLGIGAIASVAAGALALLFGIVRILDGLDTRVSSDAAFAGVVVLLAVLTVALTHFQKQIGYVGGLVLVAVYAVVLLANSRSDGDGVVTWWLRIVMPIVFAAVVLLPPLADGFSVDSLLPVVVAAVLIAVAAAAAFVGTRTRPD